MAHITHHAVSKITLFLCAGSIYVSAHKTKVSELPGLARRMPWTMAAFALASLSVIGIPPTCGFVSKWYLALGTVDAGRYVLLGVLLVSSLLNAAYLWPIVFKAYFAKEETPPTEEIRENPRARSARLRAADRALPPVVIEKTKHHVLDTLAALHLADPEAVGLGDLGRREAYLDRQLSRWRTQFVDCPLALTSLALLTTQSSRARAGAGSARDSRPPSSPRRTRRSDRRFSRARRFRTAFGRPST